MPALSLFHFHCVCVWLWAFEHSSRCYLLVSLWYKNGLPENRKPRKVWTGSRGISTVTVAFPAVSWKYHVNQIFHSVGVMLLKNDQTIKRHKINPPWCWIQFWRRPQVMRHMAFCIGRTEVEWMHTGLIDLYHRRTGDDTKSFMPVCPAGWNIISLYKLARVP